VIIAQAGTLRKAYFAPPDGVRELLPRCQRLARIHA
jgi:hypothetical protein